MVRFALTLLACLLLASALAPRPIFAQQAELTILNRDGTGISRLTDGDTVRLRLTLAVNAAEATTIEFLLEGSAAIVAACTVGAGSNGCETENIAAYGWYWDDSGAPRSARALRAASNGTELTTAAIEVAPRPVVYVHGFGATAETWRAHLGAEGFLARVGLHGYAVGDGQAQGEMDTGILLDPAHRTNTIAENAAIVGRYIEQVKAATGASQVDLVAHSMGGLISRYYIARVMGGRDVAQLIMLGSPQQGTACANLPASLNFHLPATLEIRPSYVRDIFNQQITDRREVPFYILAGTSILSEIQSPCENVPSDIVISRASAGGIPATVTEMSVLHTDMNLSEAVFSEFLLPLLRKPPGGHFLAEPSPGETAVAESEIQFTHVLTGHVAANASADVIIELDEVSVANFALFDPTQSLTVTVRGASGNVIDLDPSQHGLVVVDNPETLVYLGYGFNNPNPGAWRLTLQSTERTPPDGADFAVTATLHGGALLEAATSTLLPEVGAPVEVSARLLGGGVTLPLQRVDAIIRRPDGGTESLSLTPQGEQFSVAWRPDMPGLYGIDVLATGTLESGATIERSQFLTVEAQDTWAQPSLRAIGGIAALILVALAVLIALVGRRAKR